MGYCNNFQLNKKAKKYAKQLIDRTKKKYTKTGGIISKSNVKLDDNNKEIKDIK